MDTKVSCALNILSEIFFHLVNFPLWGWRAEGTPARGKAGVEGESEKLLSPLS